MTEVSGALLRLLAGRPVRSWRLVVAMPSLRAPLNLLHALLLPHMLVPPPRDSSARGDWPAEGPLPPLWALGGPPPVSSDVCSRAPRHTLLGKQSRREGRVVGFRPAPRRRPVSSCVQCRAC